MAAMKAAGRESHTTRQESLAHPGSFCEVRHPAPLPCPEHLPARQPRSGNLQLRPYRLPPAQRLERINEDMRSSHTLSQLSQREVSRMSRMEIRIDKGSSV